MAPSLLEEGEEDAAGEELSADEVAGVKLSADEQAEVDGEFTRMDTNADGFVDSKELEKEELDAEQLADLFEVFDADKDGKLSKSEAMTMRAASMLQEIEGDEEDDEEMEEDEEP